MPAARQDASHGEADRHHELCGRAGRVLAGEAVGAVRRRSRASQHRPRVHRSACRPRQSRRDRRQGRRFERDAELPGHRRGVVAVRPLAGGRGRGAGRSRRHHARAVARLLRGRVRHHEGRRHRRAAVHALRARRREAAGRRLQAPPAGDQRREGAAYGVGRSARRRRRHRLLRRPGALRAELRCRHDGRFARHLPVHVGHDPRVARGGQAQPPLDRHPDGGGALRHGPAARRSLPLPVLASLGPRPVARHPGAARARHHRRRLRRQVQRRAAVVGAAGAPVHQHLGGGHALSDDAQLRRGGSLSLRHRETLLHRRADRQRDGGFRRAHVRSAGLQHVWHHRDRRHPGELPRGDRLPGQAWLARQADPRRPRRGARRPGQAVSRPT